MVIQHNMPMMFAQKEYKITTDKQKKSAEKLSSGYKINRAADDAAGLSISEKMRWQIRGLNKAEQNIQDGISYCNVAEGALGEVHAMLDRVKELSVQAANDTNTDSDRQALDAEVQQLNEQINNIFKETSFNTMPIWQAAYVPSAGGADVKDFSLYNVTDATGKTYAGGITYMEHRYSWADLGVGFDASTGTFTETKEYSVNIPNAGTDGTTGNDAGSTADNYIGQAAFKLHTVAGQRDIMIDKTYKWSADDLGIYIDGVMTKGANPKEGDTTWGAMGLTKGQFVPEGTYAFNYYGMEVSFDVPAGGAEWDDFVGGINNPHMEIDWHSTYVGNISNEVADISNVPTSITINASNKDYISTDTDAAYTIKADADGVWMENGIDAVSQFNKDSAISGTLTKWENLGNTDDANNTGNHNIGSWGENGNSTSNVSVGENTTYHYENSAFQVGNNGKFSYDLNIFHDASLGGVIEDVSATKFSNRGITSPTDVTLNVKSADGKMSLTGGNSTLNFITQRDRLGREYNSDTELFASGKITRNTVNGNYELELAGSSNSSMKDTFFMADSDGFEKKIVEALKNAKSTVEGNGTYSASTGLNLGSYEMKFQNAAGDKVSFNLDLSSLNYGDVKNFTDDTDFSNYVKNQIDSLFTEASDTNNAGNIKISGNGQTTQTISMTEKNTSQNRIVHSAKVEGFDMSINIQAGAMNGQLIGLSYSYLRLGSLDMSGASVSTRSAAEMTISRVDKAIEKVSEQRSLFGAYTNRLEHAYNVDANIEENTQASESRIRDTDMATEMMEYSKNNILAQAGQAIITQANQQVQGVVTLLQA